MLPHLSGVPHLHVNRPLDWEANELGVHVLVGVTLLGISCIRIAKDLK